MNTSINSLLYQEALDMWRYDKSRRLAVLGKIIVLIISLLILRLAWMQLMQGQFFRTSLTNQPLHAAEHPLTTHGRQYDAAK